MADSNTVSVLFPKDTVQVLRKLAEEQHISLGEALARALANEMYFHEVRKRHEKILIEKKDGSFREVHFK